MLIAQPTAKLCLGFIQTWIIVELTYHIRKATHSSPVDENWLRYGRVATILITTIGFVVINAIPLFRPGKDGVYFNGNLDTVINCMGYCFLLLFILMGAVNIALFASIHAKNELQQNRTY